jgi:hypothetical protein
VNRWTVVLNDSQRQEWNSYALGNPEIDGFGTPVNIGGMGWYQRTNISRLLAGLSPVDDPPVITGPASFTITPPVATFNAGNIDIAFDNTDEWATLEFSPLVPVSATWNALNFRIDLVMSGALDMGGGAADGTQFLTDQGMPIIAGTYEFPILTNVSVYVTGAPAPPPSILTYTPNFTLQPSLGYMVDVLGRAVPGFTIPVT